MKLKAAKTSILLSLLFLVVYPACNWITAHRPDVGTWFYEWERLIPFVPLMIVPYMSIDLFFMGAPFLCHTERELQVLARRMAFAILAAGACFLVLPLRFAFERPEVSGWLGAIFDSFLKLDRPYNLFPSLHIVLRTILAHAYARHTKGVVRAGVHTWFTLVGFSTVLTYQHHVVDVAGGFVLAAVCFYLFREEETAHEVTRNSVVALYYGAGAVAAVVAGVAFWPHGALLLWPAASLGILASAYLGAGPRVFRKTQGRLPLSARVLLAPVLIGQYVSLWYYKRRCRAWDEVLPGLFIGRRLGAREASELGAAAVLDLTAEFSEPRPLLALGYRNIPILDLTAPTHGQMIEGAAFIAEHLSRGRVFVHCKIGYSRTAAMAGAYLLISGKARTAVDAVSALRAARPSLIVRPEALAALTALERSRP